MELFLTPASAREAPVVRVAERAAPRALAVVCAPPAAALAGAAVALAALARGDAGVAVVCRWTGGHDEALRGSGLATGAARRLAARLAGRDLAAAPRGRLVTVSLPADPGAAVAAAARTSAAAGDAPVVVVVAGARPTGLDPLLAGQERVIVVPDAAAPDGLEALAVADAARVGRATGVLRLGAATPARAAAIGGWVLPPALRVAVGAALDGHGA
jgi:hypothetical protein